LTAVPDDSAAQVVLKNIVWLRPIVAADFSPLRRELAVALGKPSADAARVAVARAVYRLAREITNVE